MHLTATDHLSLQNTSCAPVLRFPDLERTGTITHALLTRLGGVSASPFDSLNVSLSVGDDPAAVAENRDRARTASGLGGSRFAGCYQVSGNSVHIVGEVPSHGLPRADALVTRTPGVTLAMTFADCLPILLADPSVPMVSLVHAGWRGSLSLVAVHAWEAMRSLGARAETTTAYIGPGIGPCCYQVGEEMRPLVSSLEPQKESWLVRREGKLYLDLPRLNASLLHARGLEVVQSRTCTSCHRETFFSHRGDRGHTGRFAVYAGIA